MRIIISPAKKMKVNQDLIAYTNLPVFIKNTDELLNLLKNLGYETLKKMWGCNDTIAAQNYERISNMNLQSGLTPAIISYEGIQYQYMAPTVFETEWLEYIQKNLRILSGFYGVLKPLDGVTPYRLEMQAKLKFGEKSDLYEYWSDSLYQEVRDESGIIINLASKEYSKCIEKYLTENDTYITCIFGEMSDGKLVQKGTYAKMARGEMVRFMAEKQISNPEEIKNFDRLGYVFREDISSETEYIWIKLMNKTGL